MKLPTRPQLLTAWRPIRIPTILILLYLALHPFLAALSARHGFGSPDGFGLPYLVITAATLALRLTLLIIVPTLLTYRLTVWTATRLLRRVAHEDRDESGLMCHSNSP